MDNTPNEDVNMPSSSDASGLEPLKRVILCQPILNQIVDMWRSVRSLDIKEVSTGELKNRGRG